MPKKAKSASSEPLPDLKKLFVGKKICIAGRFKWHPSKEDLTKFFTDRGGKIVEKVDGSLDMLIIGDGRKPAKQTQAEKLNLAGKAKIEIVEELSALVPFFEASLPLYLADPKQIDESAKLLRTSWLRGGYLLGLEHLELNQWDMQASRRVELRLGLENCVFNRGKWQNLHFESPRVVGWGAAISKCTFDRTEFDNVDFSGCEECTFKKISGSAVTLGDLEGCTLDGCKLDTLQYSDIKGSHITGLSVGHFKSYFLDNSIVQSEISDCKFEKLTAKHLVISSAKLSGVSLRSLEFESLSAEKSEVANCSFTSGESSSMKFESCQLVDCQFADLKCDVLDLTDSNVVNVKFVSCEIGSVIATEQQLTEISGLSKVKGVDAKDYPKVQGLAKALVSSDKLQIDIDAKCGRKKVHLEVDRSWGVDFNYKGSGNHQGEQELRSWRAKFTIADVFRQLHWLVSASKIDDVDVGSLRVKSSKCPLKPKELKQLIADAFYEAIGKTAPTEEELKQAASAARKKKTTTKSAIVAELKAGDVKALNRRSKASIKDCGPYRKLDLSGVDLSGLRATDVNFGASNFAGANLSGAKLAECNFLKSDLSKANLSGADLTHCNLEHVNLTSANLQNAKLGTAKSAGAILRKADLTGADLSDKYWSFSLKGLDLSSVKLKDAKLDGCEYDEKTRLPKGLTKAQLEKLEWVGGGIAPHLRKQNSAAKDNLTFDELIGRLSEITDKSRLTKSLKMLKSDSFQLFSEVTNESVIGVVKSQSDASLVYSCSLDASGEFACCTQNLNPCGGLRGALCKHILVLIVGLAQTDELSPVTVDQWVNASAAKSPDLDKDRMSEILLKYKGAEAGEIDWRPTETVPEDFMAF